MWLVGLFSRMAAVEAPDRDRRRYCLSALGARVRAKMWTRAVLTPADGEIAVEEVAGRFDQAQARDTTAALVRRIADENQHGLGRRPRQLDSVADALGNLTAAAGRPGAWAVWWGGERMRTVSFYRSPSDLAFSATEIALVRFALHSASWLYGDETSVATVEDSSTLRLTPAQRQVLIWLVAGKSKPAIARALQRSIHTVDSHTRAIYGAFGVRGRAALVRRVAEDPKLRGVLAEQSTGAPDRSRVRQVR